MLDRRCRPMLHCHLRFLIYSCWETTYDNFLLKLVHAMTKSQTQQILKRVVANAERRDLIAHQSHFHICKLCASNPIPCLEVMIKDLEIGFNVNMFLAQLPLPTKPPHWITETLRNRGVD